MRRVVLLFPVALFLFGCTDPCVKLAEFECKSDALDDYVQCSKKLSDIRETCNNSLTKKSDSEVLSICQSNERAKKTETCKKSLEAFEEQRQAKFGKSGQWKGKVCTKDDMFIGCRTNLKKDDSIGVKLVAEARQTWNGNKIFVSPGIKKGSIKVDESWDGKKYNVFEGVEFRVDNAYAFAPDSKEDDNTFEALITVYPNERARMMFEISDTELPDLNTFAFEFAYHKRIFADETWNCRDVTSDEWNELLK